MASRARQAIMIVKTTPASPFIRDYSWKELRDEILSKTGGKDCKRIFHWPYFDAILLFIAKAHRLGKSFSLLLSITDLNTALLVERSLTATISYISSAPPMLECWKNLSKLTNQGVYQILVYRNDLLLSLPTGVPSLPLAARFFISSHVVFCAALWLTERLEEAKILENIFLYCVVNLANFRLKFSLQFFWVIDWEKSFDFDTTPLQNLIILET